METQVFEGTRSEIQRRLSDLPLAPDQRVRVVVAQVSDSMEGGVPEAFHPTEFRNGVPLLPRREVTEPVDLDLVKSLLDTEELDLLRADRVAGR